MTEKHVGEEKVYLAHTSTSKFIAEGSQDRNLEAGADAEAMEGAAYCKSFQVLFGLLSYRTQDHQPRDGPPPRELPPPPHQSLRKYPTGLPTDWSFFFGFSI